MSHACQNYSETSTKLDLPSFLKAPSGGTASHHVSSFLSDCLKWEGWNTEVPEATVSSLLAAPAALPRLASQGGALAQVSKSGWAANNQTKTGFVAPKPVSMLSDCLPGAISI